MDGALQQFGENVRQARLDRGWTQEDLADKTDLAVVQYHGSSEASARLG
jgi:transcriptional regulator with XRE-family HTH domain